MDHQNRNATDAAALLAGLMTRADALLAVADSLGDAVDSGTREALAGSVTRAAAARSEAAMAFMKASELAVRLRELAAALDARIPPDHPDALALRARLHGTRSPPMRWSDGRAQEI